MFAWKGCSDEETSLQSENHPSESPGFQGREEVTHIAEELQEHLTMVSVDPQTRVSGLDQLLSHPGIEIQRCVLLNL